MRVPAVRDGLHVPSGTKGVGKAPVREPQARPARRSLKMREPVAGMLPPNPPPTQTSYDLRPFAAMDRRLNARATRIFLGMGLGFTGGGVALALYLALFVQFDPWVTSFLLILFTGVGFGPLLLSEVPARGWRPRVELRLDDRGVAVVDRAGHARRLEWDDPAAVVTVREIVGSGPSGKTAALGEWLMIMPGAWTAHIGEEARQGLLAACEAHGFVLGEDRFDVPNPADHGRTAVAAVLRMAARPPPGGAFGPPTLPVGGQFRGAAPQLQSADSTFPAPPTQPSYTSGELATEPNPISQVTVAPEGARVTLRDGKTLELDWRFPGLRIDLFALLPTPVSTLADAPAWRVSVRRPSCRGSLSPAAYDAWTGSAKAAGCMVTTFRFPRPDRGSIGWGAITTIRRAVPP